MARTNVTPDATDPNAPATDAPVTPATAEVSEPKTTGTVMIQLPVALKELIEAKAKEAEVNTAAWIRKLLADTVQYTLPLPAARGRKSKYADMSVEQAKAAKAADSVTRQKSIKALLLAARNKDIDIEALLAKYANEIEIKPRKTAEEKAAEAAEAAANAEVVTGNAAEVPVVAASSTD